MNNNILIFDYQGNNIPFELTGNDVMINATEMAKPFKKRITDWKRLPSTQEYLNALLKVGFSHLDQLIISEWGGSHIEGTRGTWMHRLVAIEFARWLSPEFSIWCNMKIDELINQGYALRDAEIQKLQFQLSQVQPQVDYYNRVLQNTETLYTTRDICQELGLGISNKQFIKELISRGYGYRDGKKFYLKSPWVNEGYRRTVTEKCNDGVLRSVTRWTEPGKHWLWGLAIKWKLI